MKQGIGRVLWVLFSRILGLLIFLLVLLFVNMMAAFVPSPIFQEMIHLLNNNVGLIVVLSIVMFVADLFLAMSFPFNIPGPLFNAAASLLIATFILRLLVVIDSFAGTSLYAVVSSWSPFIFPLIFLIVLLAGYIDLFTNLDKHPGYEQKAKGPHRHSKK